MGNTTGKSNTTVAVPEDLHQKLSRNLPYGQRSQLILKFLDNIERAIDENRKEEYLSWLYDGKAFTLT